MSISLDDVKKLPASTGLPRPIDPLVIHQCHASLDRCFALVAEISEAHARERVHREGYRAALGLVERNGVKL